jgi:hypothetical protein
MPWGNFLKTEMHRGLVRKFGASEETNRTGVATTTGSGIDSDTNFRKATRCNVLCTIVASCICCHRVKKQQNPTNIRKNHVHHDDFQNDVSRSHLE